ncbi:hypothetical protein J25TS5_16180 [Paenibacillus faecis]|uniref:hypothetical protein n=1 Tax=Paenibacillus faecis TaxID=862114 RepID=UPI001B1EBA32|nr:hypothetical protein [Paenibacillus faecis]GIO84686.1 hypothetical protein J25TS5_16180 [Paenibacillus faecis]
MESEIILKKVRNYFILERYDLLYKIESNILVSFLGNDNYLCFCRLIQYAEKNDFIRERVVFKNNRWVEPWWQPDTFPSLAWFRTKNESEIREAIRNNQHFSCIVLKEGQEFDEYSYVLSCVEDDIGDSLNIYPKDESKFIEYVLPQLCELIGNLKLDI